MVSHHFWTFKTRFAFAFIAAWWISTFSIRITVILVTGGTFIIINTCDAVIVKDDRSVFGKSFITSAFIAATIVDAVSMMRTLNTSWYVLRTVHQWCLLDESQVCIHWHQCNWIHYLPIQYYIHIGNYQYYLRTLLVDDSRALFGVWRTDGGNGH